MGERACRCARARAHTRRVPGARGNAGRQRARTLTFTHACSLRAGASPRVIAKSKEVVARLKRSAGAIGGTGTPPPPDPGAESTVPAVMVATHTSAQVQVPGHRDAKLRRGRAPISRSTGSAPLRRAAGSACIPAAPAPMPLTALRTGACAGATASAGAGFPARGRKTARGGGMDARTTQHGRVPACRRGPGVRL